MERYAHPRYTGYLDALVQRWVLVADEFLRCPGRYVLARYEDFREDPVRAAAGLLENLGLGEHWTEEAAWRVAQAAGQMYQAALFHAPSEAPREALGAAQHARIVAAVGARARLLGYPYEADPADAAHLGAPIDVPPLPAPDCGR